MYESIATCVLKMSCDVANEGNDPNLECFIGL